MKKLVFGLFAALIAGTFVACGAPASGDVITKDEQAKLTPASVLADLKAGNERFVSQRMIKRDYDAQVEATAGGQSPQAVVLSCLDSRVPVETVLDQGIGDVFVARVAGNFVNEDILGSMEFATKVVGTKIVLVMGHERCGAVKAAIDDVKLGNITPMLTKIKPAVAAAAANFEGDASTGNPEFVSRVGEQNVIETIAAIRERSPIMREMEEKGEIQIVGAVYSLDTGKIRFLN
ncbi:MAG: carbonic anhydrase family protein [Leptospirales bacterium]|jgi:carbonic anhydrase